jgi:hypothetical protein
MYAFRHGMLSLVFLLALVGVPGQAGAASSNPSLAGHWVAQLFWRCAPGGGIGDPVCPLAADAPGPVTLAITWDIVSNAAGSASFTYEATMAGIGNSVSAQCNGKLYASTAFKGVCPMTAHGTGYFDVTDAGFVVTDERVTFHGKSVTANVHNATSVGGNALGYWPIPPQPGYYDNYTVSSRADTVNKALATTLAALTGIEFRVVVARY